MTLRIRGCHPLRPAFPDRSASFTQTTGLFRFRSPLLTESRLMSVPPGTEMFQFPGFASPHYVFMQRYPIGVGCPIRISTDQRLLAAPRGFSQRATSFIASWCQGIHRMPFFHSKSRRHAQEQTLPSRPQGRANKITLLAGHISIAQMIGRIPSQDATNRTSLNAHATPRRSDSRHGTPSDAPEPDSP